MFKPSYNTTASTKENFVLTEEQEDIVNSARAGDSLAIAAFAGASKTTTCKLIADAVPTTSLYIAFNKSIAEEAATKFPSYVDCRTVHSLAYRKIVTPKMRAKVQNFWQMSDLDKFVPAGLHLEQQIISFKYGLTQAVASFCQSAEDNIKIHYYNNIPDEETGELAISAAILSKIETFWKECILSSSNIKITPDVYLKLFQLSRPVLPYDVIYLDECQDSNEVTLELFLSQQEHGKQLIAVGDKYQSIYAWRGATNGFERIERTEGFVLKTLSTSFRFTQDIADRAFWITELFLGNNIKIKGLAMPVEEETFRDRAIIVRNNSTLLEQLLIAEKEQQKVYVIADLTDLWSKLYHIDSLYYEKHIQYPNKELKYYPTYAALKAAADHSAELQKLLKATMKLSIGGLHTNITKIKSIIVGSKEEAEFTLSTGHKCKGLEFEEVTLMPDLLPEKLKTDEGEETEEEYRKRLMKGQTFQLLYVALTRAKYKLHLPENIVNYIFQGYFNGEQV